MKMAMGKTIDDILNDEALNWLLGYLEVHQWNDGIKHMESEEAYGTLEAIKTYQKQVYEYWNIEKEVKKD